MTDATLRLIIVILTFLLAVAFWGWIAVKGFPQDSHDIVLAFQQALILWIGGIIGYFFGSSSGSAAKDQTISATLAQSTPKPPTP